MTPASAFRVEATQQAIMAAIEAHCETEAEGVEALFCVLAAKLVELEIPADRGAEHFKKAMLRAYAVTVDAEPDDEPLH